jgi:hypothetical protein
MEQEFEKTRQLAHPVSRVQWTDPVEKTPMHPDDFNALLAWITAKRFHEVSLEKTFAEKPVFNHIIG